MLAFSFLSENKFWQLVDFLFYLNLDEDTTI